MSTISCTIGGNSVSVLNHSFTDTKALEVRSTLQFTVIDSSGTAIFTPDQPVVFSDSVSGVIFSGYVATDAPQKLSPDPNSTTVLHVITCKDKQDLLGKRTCTTNYLNWYAGDAVVNMVQSTLAAEGVTVAAAQQHTTTVSDWNTGTLSGTMGVADTSDGALQIATAGSNLTITESATSDFSSGTLTNMVASSNTLTPATTSGLKVVATLPYPASDSSIIINFWSGSKALGTNDTLNYDLWIASTSPAFMATVGLTFSDGSQTTGIVDQNGLAIDATTDLTNYAKDTWYTRNISTTTYNGKTVTAVWISFAGASQGTYAAWVKNVYLSSDASHPFFSTTATAPQLNPMVVASVVNYLASVTSQVAPVFNPAASLRTSNAYSIDAVKLLQSSTVLWNAITPGNSSSILKVSYDGGTTYQPCTNSTALPALPVGSTVAGLSVTLQESFGAGSDPSILPTLESVSIALNSAANATKSDIVTTFATQTQWNTGTYNGASALSNGDLTSGTVSRDWNNNLITNQTFFTNGSGISQAASSGKYGITIPVSTSVNETAISRLDFAGTLVSFTLDVDVSIPSTFNFSFMLIIAYRQTYWASTPPTDFGTGGYTLQVSQSGGGICRVYRGTNSSSDTKTSVASSGPDGVTHVKIVCNGSHHQIYFNNSTTATFDFTDSTFASGQIGLGGFTFLQNPGGSPNSGTITFDNLVVTPNPIGTWTGPATSLSSLGTCGNSVISWTEANTGASVLSSVMVQSSVDGGSTFQTCTNGGAIPNLPSGTNVSSKTLQLLITLYAYQAYPLPVVRQLVWRVLGQYPGASGTRSTAPLGIDTAVRANQSGWGTAFDGQTWTKTGTGTDAVSSDELTITNTTGDVHEILGSKTGAALDGTVRFSLSASAIVAGMELRYVDANNFYRLQASTTAVSIAKKITGTLTTIASTSTTLATGTWYRMRFRVVGTNPVKLYGNVWLDGTLEPTIDATTYQWNDANWTLTAND